MTRPKNILFLAIFTSIFLWWQAQQPTWNSHMQVDVWISWQRINYWFTHAKSFVGLTGNEILPATLMYVFAPILLSINSAFNYQIYLPLALIINFVILACHMYLIKDKKIFLMSLLFLGPILLFRFEPMVTLLTLLSFEFFRKEYYKLSGLWLGLATAMKVYPIIFLPYYLIILFKNKKIKSIESLLIFFMEAILVPVLIFILMGGSLEQIRSALLFHGQKLISIESVPGSIITALSLIKSHVPPTLIPGNGIWAVGGPAKLFNNIWMIPMTTVYIFIWKSKHLTSSFNYLVPYTIILIFLFFSKNLNPQYLWWFMAILPMIKPSKTTYIITLVVAMLNQIVFPIYYTTFVESFFRNHDNFWIYYVLLLRNFGFVALVSLAVKQLIASLQNK